MSSAQSIPRVLVYTATAGYRHESIPTAIEVLKEQGPKWNVSFDFSEDPNLFTNETLSEYDGVFFALNSNEVLNATGQAALQTFFQSGGVYCGAHSGSACLYNDTNYQEAVGALFDYHPSLQDATFIVLNNSHPSTSHLPDRFTWVEEVYNFRSDPRSNGAVVLLTVDENSYNNDGTSTGNYPPQGSPHPIAWYIDSPKSAQPLLPGASKAGRSFYTSMGHLNTTWQNETFIEHIMGGLTWALEGASTKAYGAGLVGNGTSPSGAATGSASSSANPSASSGGVSGSSGAATSSGSGGHSASLPKGAGMVLGASVIAVGVGMSLVL